MRQRRVLRPDHHRRRQHPAQHRLPGGHHRRLLGVHGPQVARARPLEPTTAATSPSANDDVFTPDCGSAGSILRTWTVTDECGNVASCDQTITIVDNTPPSIDCPADTTVDCSGSTDPGSTGSATGADDCGDVTVSYDDVFTPDCGSAGSILRTWTVTDECGNVASCDQTITIVDNTPPSIDCPADTTVDCSGSTDPGSTGSATGADDCGDVTVSYDDVFTPDCGNAGSILRTWTVTDECGNVASCDQTITIVDNTPPSIDCPADTTVECSGSTDPGSTGSATGADDCGDVTVSYDDVFTPDCGNAGSILRTWTVTDECGNVASCDQTITVVDNTPPSIDCPADTTVECSGSTDPGSTGSATGADDCGDVTVSYDDVFTPDCGNAGSILRTWTVTDECGNVASCDQTITVVDNTPPSIDCPADTTVECSGSTDPGSTGSATGADDCGDVTVSYDDVFTPDCGSAGSILRTWTVTDECGNVASCDQTITIVDNTPPEISCPADLTLECTDSTDPADTGSATGTDECGEVTIDHEDTFLSACGNTGVITRVWSATDECGNAISCTQTLTIVDNTAPEITCPDNATVECSESTEPADTGMATATDECGEATVDYEDNFEPACGDTGMITRTWTAEDECGNVSSCEQIIRIIDSTVPELTCPADLTVDCTASTNPIDTGEATASDDCGEVTIDYEDTFVTDCGSAGTLTRTWTATDECGNVASCDQVITVVDNTAPEISCPSDLTVDCTASTDPANTGNATALDDCGDATVDYEDSFAPECGNTGTITRRWTATDDCGNTASCDQLITIVDQTAPEIFCPPDFTTCDCTDATSDCAGTATGTDDCDDEVTITHTDSTATVDDLTIITRTWTATDDCGNSISCDQLITLQSPTTATELARCVLMPGRHADPGDHSFGHGTVPVRMDLQRDRDSGSKRKQPHPGAAFPS